MTGDQKGMVREANKPTKLTKEYNEWVMVGTLLMDDEEEEDAD